MEKTREPADEVQPRKSGAARDVAQLKRGAVASIEELREFVANLKGRSPKEVLGIVASSALTKGIVQATVGCAILLVVLTVIPYAMADGKRQEQIVAKAKADADAATASAAKQEAADAEAAKKTEAAGTSTGDSVQANQAKAANAMGIDKVKDPDANPLDQQLNNLLDIK